MKDYEISRALALAIGWKPHQLNVATGFTGPVLFCCVVPAKFASKPTELSRKAVWRMFDYRAPDVIWPIAERFDCFPTKLLSKSKSKWWALFPGGRVVYAYTAAEAVAMAVIWS